MNAGTQVLYQKHCSYLNMHIDMDVYNQFFATEGKTLVAFSPNLWAFAKKSGVDIDYMPCKLESQTFLANATKNEVADTYDTIIADLDTDKHKRFDATRSDPAYMCHFRYLMRVLNPGGTIKVKLPYRAVKFFTSRNGDKITYSWLNITDLHICEKYVYATIRKEMQGSKTNISWDTGDSMVADIHNIIIAAKYVPEYYDAISDSINYTTFEYRYFDHRHRGAGYTGTDLTAGQCYNSLMPKVDINRIIFCPRGSWNPQPLADCLDNKMSGEAYIIPDGMSPADVLSALTSRTTKTLLKSLGGLNNCALHHRSMMFSPEFVRLFNEG